MSAFSIPPEMREKYLSRRRIDLEILSSSLEARSADEFKRIGHQLKGNARSFGYQQLELIGQKFEDAAERKDFVELKRQMDAFRDFIEIAIAQGT